MNITVKVFLLICIALLTSCSSYEKRPDLTEHIKAKFGQEGINYKAQTNLRNATHKASTLEKARHEQEDYLIKALESKATDQDKEFYIHELKLIGKEDSIPVLAKYLNHPILGSHASMALLSIHNAIEDKDEVTKAFSAALPSAKGKNLLLMVKNLGSLKVADDATIREIEKYIGSKDIVMKLAATRALANFADPASADVLLNTLKGQTKYNRSKFLSYNLLYARNLMAEDKSAASIHATKTLSRVIAEKEPHSYIKSLATLQEIKGAEFTDSLIKQLNNKSHRVRAAVANLLIAGSDKALNKKISDAYHSGSPEFQAEVLKVLVGIKDPHADKYLAQGLKNKNQYVRLISIELTAYVQPLKIVSPLANLVLKGTKEDGSAAAAALKRIPSKFSCSELLKIYGQADDEVKATLLTIIGNQRDKEVSQVVLAATLSANKSLKKEAFKSLKMIAEFEQISSYISFLKESQSSSDIRGFQSAIVTAAYSKEDKAAAEVIKNISTNSSAKANLSLIQVLSRISGKKAYRGLLNLYSNGSEPVQTEAVRGMAKWTSITEFHDLILFTKSLEGKNRLLMVRGITALIVNSASSTADKKMQLDKLIAIAPDSEKKNLMDKAKSLK
jgi:HEAT repeat protein